MIDDTGQNNAATFHVHAQLGPLDCLKQPLVMKRFHNVIGRVCVKGSCRKTIECAHKDNCRDPLAARFHHLKARYVG